MSIYIARLHKHFWCVNASNARQTGTSSGPNEMFGVNSWIPISAI